MRTKVTALITAFALAAGLSACGGSSLDACKRAYSESVQDAQQYMAGLPGNGQPPQSLIDSGYRFIVVQDKISCPQTPDPSWGSS